MKQLSKSPVETQKIAQELIKNLPNGAVICLYGELGSGKTVFSKGLAQALGIEKRAIKSPTFTIVREYTLDKGKLYHYDFYRQEEPDHILMQTFEENYSNSNNYIFIEWADRIKQFLPQKRVDVFLEYGKNPDERIIKITKL